MSRLRIISHQKLENASHMHDKFSAMNVNSNNLQRVLRNRLSNIIDKELAEKIILSYVKTDENITVTNDIKAVLDVVVNATVRLKTQTIDIYDLGLGASSVASLLFIYIHDDTMPISLLVAHINRHEYVYAPVLLKGASRVYNTLLADS